jgi:hypothetical protein
MYCYRTLGTGTGQGARGRIKLTLLWNLQSTCRTWAPLPPRRLASLSRPAIRRCLLRFPLRRREPKISHASVSRRSALATTAGLSLGLLELVLKGGLSKTSPSPIGSAQLAENSHRGEKSIRLAGLLVLLTMGATSAMADDVAYACSNNSSRTVSATRLIPGLIPVRTRG